MKNILDSQADFERNILSIFYGRRI